MSRINRVVLVGHCGADSWSLTRAVRDALGDMDVATANNTSELDALAGPDALLLVNRVLDGRFDVADGIDLIGQVTSCDDAGPAMLISNYDDAQAEAESAGAVRGFGKSDVSSPATGELLRAACDN